MPKAKDFESVVDEKGRKTKVLMSYRLFKELFEDFDDLRVKAKRQHEVPEDFEKVTEELRAMPGGYRVQMWPSAKRELLALRNPVLRRVHSAIESLSINPRARGCRKLSGHHSRYRSRAGDYRVIYEIDDDSRSVWYRTFATEARLTTSDTGQRPGD